MQQQQLDKAVRVRALNRLLRSTAEALAHQCHNVANAPKLSPSQYAVLEALHQQDRPLSQRELAGYSRRSSGNMTLVVDNLEKRELVQRCSSKSDRRVVQVCLTERGRDLIETLLPGHTERLLNIFSALDDEEMHQLETSCEKLNRRMNKE